MATMIAPNPPHPQVPEIGVAPHLLSDAVERIARLHGIGAGRVRDIERADRGIVLVEVDRVGGAGAMVLLVDRLGIVDLARQGRAAGHVADLLLAEIEEIGEACHPALVIDHFAIEVVGIAGVGLGNGVLVHLRAPQLAIGATRLRPG
jgi:hypothetical protein